MGLRGEAAIVGFTELPTNKRPTGPLESTHVPRDQKA
jgi:hypothetical protein